MPAGPVEHAIRGSIQPGQVLRTPTQRAPFTVSKVDNDGVILLLGRANTLQGLAGTASREWFPLSNLMVGKFPLVVATRWKAIPGR